MSTARWIGNIDPAGRVVSFSAFATRTENFNRAVDTTASYHGFIGVALDDVDDLAIAFENIYDLAGFPIPTYCQ